MAAIGKNTLWNPKVGIRFLASPEPLKTPLYPQLDMPRFFQTAAEIGCSNEETEVCPVSRVNGDSSKSSSMLHDNGVHDKASTPVTVAKVRTGNQPQIPRNQTSDSAAGDGCAEGIQPPATSLGFNISHDLFHAARAAPVGSPSSFWSYTMYQRTTDSGAREKVKVHYCTSKHSMEQVCRRHFLHQDVIGFDLEWLPYASRSSGPRENVSLVQLASADRIGLFHLALFSTKSGGSDDLVSPTFRQIMEDARVTKVGVHIQGDCTRLKNYLGVETKGVFELSHLFKQVKYTAENRPRLINKVPVSLSTQVQECLKLPMFKGDHIRSSNWMKPLTTQQVLYSASDAYAGVQLYHVLEAKRKKMDPSPARPYHAELGLPIPVAEPRPGSLVPSEEALSSSDSSEFASVNQSTIFVRTQEKAAASTAPQKQVDSRILMAERSVATYRASKRTSISTQPAALRTYYLWHSNIDLHPAAIAKMLREPPLQTNTVVSYILNAIVAEKLPYERARLKSEVLSSLSHRLATGSRFSALIRSCEET